MSEKISFEKAQSLPGKFIRSLWRGMICCGLTGVNIVELISIEI